MSSIHPSLSTGDENSWIADSIALDEPPHLDLHFLPSSLWILNMIKLELNTIWEFAVENFVVCFLVVKELKDRAAVKDGRESYDNS